MGIFEYFWSFLADFEKNLMMKLKKNDIFDGFSSFAAPRPAATRLKIGLKDAPDQYG